MEIKSIQIIEKNSLFADYLSDFSKVNPFYQHNFRDDWQAVIQRRSRFETPHKEMTEILAVQNQQWGAPPETAENIRRLGKTKTLAVVTGQQTGILGGPLYTFYKTMTVLKISEKLRRENPDFDFVPVFWMEVNDSDFKEISAIQYLSKDNQLKRLAVKESESEALKPVFARNVADSIREWRQLLEVDFFDTEFKEEILNTFLSPYSASHSYADAFAQLLHQFFGKYGLVIFNPANPAVSKLTKPLFAETLNSATEILKGLNERNSAIQDAGYDPQITFMGNQTLLFFNDEQLRRVRIDFDEKGQFLLKYPDKYETVEREKLLQNGSRMEISLSPNVALRPVIQDFLLPTVAYVAGPSEVAYFAQVETLYRRFDIPMPVIYPRHRLTIAEGKIEKNMRKFNLEYEEILPPPEDFMDTFVRRLADRKVYDVVHSAEQRISRGMEELKKHLAAFDPTLVNALKKTRGNIESSFRQLSSKIDRSVEQKNRVQVQQLEKILLSLYPENNYQERVLNMLYFCIKYGKNFVDELIQILPEETDRHYVVKL
jgi:bacillithiol biosynthesis cysteine-adding enzyme BshC